MNLKYLKIGLLFSFVANVFAATPAVTPPVKAPVTSAASAPAPANTAGGAASSVAKKKGTGQFGLRTWSHARKHSSTPIRQLAPGKTGPVTAGGALSVVGTSVKLGSKKADKAAKAASAKGA